MALRAIDRLKLIADSSDVMHERMDWDDIRIFLKPFSIPVNKNQLENTSFNHVGQLAKYYLNNAPEGTLIEIAQQLDVNMPISATYQLADSQYWTDGYFRLFISHLSEVKKSAGNLKEQLRKYGISAFVAHADIDPGKEWEDEIERALMSMDALAAIVSPGFKESDWCDQEVGAAVGSGKLVVPILDGEMPYGFIAKFQGVKGKGETVGNVAGSVFAALAGSRRTSPAIADAMILRILYADDQDEAVQFVSLLEQTDPAAPVLERLRESLPTRKLISRSSKVLVAINTLLGKYNLQPIQQIVVEDDFDDEIPF